MLIAERLSMSRQAMRKALLRLEDCGFIEVVRERVGVRLRARLASREWEVGLGWAFR